MPPVPATPPAQVPPAADLVVPVKPEVTLPPTTESTKSLVERLKKLMRPDYLCSVTR